MHKDKRSWWSFKKYTLYGSHLQKKVLLIFGLLAGTPALILAMLAALFSYHMLSSWFDTRISNVLNESVYIAESYLKEYQETLKAKAKNVADELDETILQRDLTSNLPMFTNVLNSLASLNDISEAVVFHGRAPVVKGRFGNALSLENIPEKYYTQAMNGETVVFKTFNKIRVMQRLHSLPNSVLVVGKYLDNKADEHIKQSIAVADEYKAIGQNLAKLQLKFYLAFLVATVILLCIAGITGILFSANLVKPIIKLVEATKSIQDGNFAIKLPEGRADDEIANLSRAFNLMAEKVSEQQQKLINACETLDRKNKFVEMVLSGVSTGIIALSPKHKVDLINEAGTKILQLQDSTNAALEKIFPEILPLLDQVSHLKSKDSRLLSKLATEPKREAHTELRRAVYSDVHEHSSNEATKQLGSEVEFGKKSISQQIKIKREGHLLTLLVKIGVEYDEKAHVSSYIIAFDDVTKIFQAQRHEAWSDIARRIAHEVKNPLTPIYLGAERIKQKYSKYIKDQKNFNMYINTIMKHSQDIGTIIGEFSNFARMPAPSFKKLDLSSLVKDVFFSYKIQDPNIKFKSNIQKNVVGFFDHTQIRQLLSNIIKNAEESVQSAPNKQSSFVEVSLTTKQGFAHIQVEDSGKGFDEKTLNKVTEPYFTTKTKGTGLGLAIVKKIVDDHEGKLIIKNNSKGNAVVEIILPLDVNI